MFAGYPEKKYLVLEKKKKIVFAFLMGHDDDTRLDSMSIVTRDYWTIVSLSFIKGQL